MGLLGCFALAGGAGVWLYGLGMGRGGRFSCNVKMSCSSLCAVTGLVVESGVGWGLGWGYPFGGVVGMGRMLYGVRSALQASREVGCCMRGGMMEGAWGYAGLVRVFVSCRGAGVPGLKAGRCWRAGMDSGLTWERTGRS